MKPIKLLFIIFICASTSTVNAQLKYLRLSPSQTIEQTIGATTVKIEFSRPQMKGRKIFGALVPYDQFWRTGANENTKITFSHRVKIGDNIVDAGTYALITKPKQTSWEIYLYTDTNNFDVPKPIESSKLIYLTSVQTNTLTNKVETLVINFYDITETDADLGISWETTEVLIPIKFFTREVMKEAIKNQFEKNAFDYSIAAAYYSERNIELEKARELQKRSIALRDKPSPWAYNSYGVILKKLGETNEAKEAITYSLELAKQSNNEYLIKENEKLLKQWGN